MEKQEFIERVELLRAEVEEYFRNKEDVPDFELDDIDEFIAECGDKEGNIAEYVFGDDISSEDLYNLIFK